MFAFGPVVAVPAVDADAMVDKERSATAPAPAHAAVLAEDVVADLAAVRTNRRVTEEGRIMVDWIDGYYDAVVVVFGSVEWILKIMI